MKKWKSLLLVCMLVFTIGMVTACGRSDNSGNQTESGTENTDTLPDNGGTGSGMGATGGPEDTGLIEETGDALQQGWMT